MRIESKVLQKKITFIKSTLSTMMLMNLFTESTGENQAFTQSYPHSPQLIHRKSPSY